MKTKKQLEEENILLRGAFQNLFWMARRYAHDNRNDLLDLYEAIYRDGKWDEFFWFSASHCKPKREGLGCSETTAWLFCLDGKDYEKRCKMVADFYGWNERDPVIDKNSGAYGDN